MIKTSFIFIKMLMKRNRLNTASQGWLRDDTDNGRPKRIGTKTVRLRVLESKINNAPIEIITVQFLHIVTMT